jgi:K+-transporting ATPase KdpF subunit
MAHKNFAWSIRGGAEIGMAGLRGQAPFSVHPEDGKPTMPERPGLTDAPGAFAWSTPAALGCERPGGQGDMIIDYLIGGVVAVLLLGYLVCVLLRPEKF